LRTWPVLLGSARPKTGFAAIKELWRRSDWSLSLSSSSPATLPARAATSLLKLIDSRAQFSAIFAANDIMAIGVLAALRERGLEVPRDISLVGFDDIPISRDLTPPLTTVAVPMAEIGRRAMQLALCQPPPEDSVTRLPTQLVRRSSVAPVRGAESAELAPAR